MKRGLSVSAILAGCLSAIVVAGCASAPELKEMRETRLNKASLSKEVTNSQTDTPSRQKKHLSFPPKTLRP